MGRQRHEHRLIMQNWGALLLVMWVAAANIAIGFALALAMGHGPARWPHCRLPRWSEIVPRWRLPGWPRAKKEAKHEEPIETTTASDEAVDEAQDNNAATPKDDPAEQPHVEGDVPTPLEMALSQLQEEVAAAVAELTTVDERVQKCAGAPTAAGLSKCTGELQDAGHRYIERLESAVRVVEAMAAENAAGAASAGSIRMAADQHAEQIRRALEKIDRSAIDPHNLHDNCLRLLGETGRMMQSCDSMSLSISEAHGRVRAGADQHALRSLRTAPMTV